MGAFAAPSRRATKHASIVAVRVACSIDFADVVTSAIQWAADDGRSPPTGEDVVVLFLNLDMQLRGEAH